MSEKNIQESLSTETISKKADGHSDSQAREVLSPGYILKTRRESTGAELEVIARELNLDTWMLLALENDDFSKLGAQVFAKGHLKHYAQHLGLNSDDVLFAYYQVAERKETTPVIKRHISAANQKRNYGSLFKWFGRLLALLAISALLYAAYKFSLSWLDSAKNSSTGTTEITLAPNNLGDSAAAESESNVALPTINNIDYASQENEIDNPSQEDATSQLDDASDTNVLDTESETTSDASEVNLLRLVFIEESWVEVFDADNKSLIYDNQKPGTQREIILNGQTSVFLGNYPGVELFFDGNEYAIPRGAKAGNTARFIIEPK